MKKKIIFFLLAVLLVMSLAVPAMAAATCYISGPKEVRAGDTVTVTFYASGDVTGINGSIQFDSEVLTLQGYTPRIGGSWLTEFSGNNFMSYDNSMSEPLGGDKAIFSATFQVSADVQPGTSVSVTASGVTLSNRKGDLFSGSVMWSKTVSQPYSDNADLESLSVEGFALEPAFDPEVQEYSFSVPFETAKLKISAKAQHANAKVSVSGTSLAENTNNKLVITVTAENGAKKDYVLKVWRPKDPNYEPSSVNFLEELTVENFLISPAFTPEQMDYAVYLPNEVESIQLNAKPTDGRAKVEVPTIENIPVGKTTYEVTVTAENGDVRIYTVTTFRAEPFLGPYVEPEETEPATEPTEATTEPTEATTEATTEPTTEPTAAPVEENSSMSGKTMGILWILSLVAAFLGGIVAPMLLFKQD